MHVLVAGANAGEAAQGRRADRRRGQGAARRRRRSLAEQPGRERRRAGAGASPTDYSHILFPATAYGKNVAPRVAAKLDVAQISDITKVDRADTFERPIYAGNAIATVQSTRRDQGHHRAHHRLRPGGGHRRQRRGRERRRRGRQRASRSFVGREIAKSDRPELTAAKIIVSGGRALGSEREVQRVLTPLADKLGAALGASRAAVDAGYAPNDWQVGPDRQDRRAAAVHRRRHLRARSSTWPA